ncbi:Mov34/MPN/PAD-1 family protein, partial [Reticulomyxa filosa]
MSERIMSSQQSSMGDNPRRHRWRYLLPNRQQSAPITFEEFQQLFNEGVLTKNSWVWHYNYTKNKWTKIANLQQVWNDLQCNRYESNAVMSSEEGERQETKTNEYEEMTIANESYKRSEYNQNNTSSVIKMDERGKENGSAKSKKMDAIVSPQFQMDSKEALYKSMINTMEAKSRGDKNMGADAMDVFSNGESKLRNGELSFEKKRNNNDNDEDDDEEIVGERVKYNLLKERTKLHMYINIHMYTYITMKCDLHKVEISETVYIRYSIDEQVIQGMFNQHRFFKEKKQLEIVFENGEASGLTPTIPGFSEFGIVHFAFYLFVCLF